MFFRKLYRNYASNYEYLKIKSMIYITKDFLIEDAFILIIILPLKHTCQTDYKLLKQKNVF